jgi:hypothetical protein
MRKIALGLGLILILTTSRARAAEPLPCEPPATPAPPTKDSWYGWQTLLVDAAALGMVLAAPAGGEHTRDPLLVAGVGTYALGGPAVHLAHAGVGRALGSLALRAGLPIGGAFVGMALGTASDHSGDAIAGGLVGFGLGLVGAVAIDASLVAWEEGTPKPRDAAPPPKPLAFAPSVAVTPHGASLGVVGAF